MDALERSIASDIADLGERLQRAASAASSASATRGGEERRDASALDRTRDLVRGLESLDERMRQQQGQAQQGGAQQGQGQQGQTQQGQAQQGRAQQGQRQGGQAQGGMGQQFAREMRERVAQGEALRRDLAAQGMDVAELDRALARMRSLTTRQSLDDGRSAAALRAQTIEGLKAFEFGLRRALHAADEQKILLGRSGDVPAAFRQYVEEYYRSIARDRPADGQLKK
jgi:hypothetical protein